MPGSKSYYYIVAVLILSSWHSFCQTAKVSLSPQHLQKLETCKTGHKHLVQYYKFYKQDSTKQSRDRERYYKKILDSAYRADRKQERLLRKKTRKGIALPDTQAALNNQLRHWWGIMKDSTASDSARSIAKEKVKTLTLERAKLYPGFQNAMDRYQLRRDSVQWKDLANQVPGLDTLGGLFDSSPKELLTASEKMTEGLIKDAGGVGAFGEQFGQAEQLNSLPDQYTQQYKRYADAEGLKAEGKDKAVKEGADYFANHTDKLQGAQQKLSKLMSKYRDIPNSNDLSTATKDTSMKGKTFWEHLVIGGNFNLVSTDPFSLDLSPQLGYKFTTRFLVGVGMNYRYTYRDSIRSTSYVSPHNTSYKLLSSYEFIRAFYAYAEWEKSGVTLNSNDNSSKVWKDNYFIGLGKRFLVHPKVYFTLTALYNLNSENNNPVHPRRFQLRMGFQLSELATRKKRIFYDPNR